jgi:hypothetical protein
MANQYPNYGQNPWAAPQQNIQQPGFFVPQASKIQSINGVI